MAVLHGNLEKDSGLIYTRIGTWYVFGSFSLILRFFFFLFAANRTSGDTRKHRQTKTGKSQDSVLKRCDAKQPGAILFSELPKVTAL